MNSRLSLIMRTLTTILFTLIALAAFVTPAAAVAPPVVVGIWTGTLQTYYCPGINCRPVNLRFVLHVTVDSAGKLGVSLDRVDQGAMDLPGDNVVLKGNAFSFDIPSNGANYQATLSADGNSLNGTWSQDTHLRRILKAYAPYYNRPAPISSWTGTRRTRTSGTRSQSAPSPQLRRLHHQYV